MFIPNLVEVYGSQYILVGKGDADGRGGSLCYQQILKITKSGLKALDQPSERCDSDTDNPNTSTCIAKYIEENLGCSMDIQGGGSTKMAPCTSWSEVNALRNITALLNESNANAIYELTGCLASCRRSEYTKIDGRVTNEICYDVPKDLHLQFLITTGSYKEEEQYIIYDFVSFIADVGGLMGLLLGCSVFSLYAELEGLLRRFSMGSLPK